jgi:hypothetical protein
MFVVESEHVHNYERQAVGRRRTRIPIWHIPPALNAQYLTSISVRIRQGQGERLEQKIIEMRDHHQHQLPGTAARYIARNLTNSDEIQIIFVWRKTFMPPDEVRNASMIALCVDLEEILSWETAIFQECQVILNA